MLLFEQTEQLVNSHKSVLLVEAAPHVLSMMDQDMTGSIQNSLLAHRVDLMVNNTVRSIQRKADKYII